MRHVPAAALVLLACARAASSGPYDPALQFRTLSTPHFAIHYHQGAEALAARLADIAEALHLRWAREWGLPTSRLTHVVLADQADLPNGTATVVPWNAIVIFPVPPTGASTIGNTSDWIEYVFTHEYAHILHLDRSRGWARAARALLGRSPIAFPNLTLPLWQIEGLATYHEAGPGGGRLAAGDFREVVDAGARSGRFEPLDRVNGGLPDWPAGQGWYAYGARFHEYLATTYGEARARDLAERTSGRLPFLTSGAFTAVYGKPLGELWADFRQATSAHVEANSDPSSATRQLTRLGFLVDGPRASADGTLYFTAADAHRFPGIYALAPDTQTPRRVVSRYGGSVVSVGTAGLLFDQLEIVRGSAMLSDLYLHDTASGRTRRLTAGARLVDPDWSPDGRRIAAVRITSGRRELVVLDWAALNAPGYPVGGDALPVLGRAGAGHDVVYATPRWSRDGLLLASERRTRGGPSTIVILDAATLREVSAIAAPPGGRFTQPAWSPDGATVLFAAAESAAAFEIRAADLGPGGRITPPRPVLRARAGASSPLLLADGRLVFVGYGASGHDLFEARPDLAQPPAAQSQTEARPAGDIERRASPASAPYRPWSTLAPRGWFPLAESRDGRLRVGGVVVAADVLARHTASAGATVGVGSAGDWTGLLSRARPDWHASYAYQRWQPAFYLSASERTSLFRTVGADGVLTPVAQRERTLDVGVWRPVRRVRWAHTLLAAYHLESLTADSPEATGSLDRAGLRAAWTFTSARRYGRSISLEDGVTAAVTVEALRPSFGGDGRSDAWTADLRAYLPLGVRHAVGALRLAAGSAAGDRAVRGRFRLGGADGNPVAGAFGSDAISLLRGFQDEIFVGDRIALANVEVRVPLASVQRGWGTWPLFLRTVHAAGFADIGHAWSGAPRWRDRKVGYGLEVSADVVAGYGLPLTATAGIGWGHDGAGLVTGAREIYVRLGRSF